MLSLSCGQAPNPGPSTDRHLNSLSMHKPQSAASPATELLPADLQQTKQVCIRPAERPLQKVLKLDKQRRSRSRRY